MEKKVYQLVVLNLQTKEKIYLSIYKKEERAKRIAKEMNIDFTKNRTQRLATVETKNYYEE